MKQALKQQELEESSGHRRKRKSAAVSAKETELDKKTEKDVDDKVKGDDNAIKPNNKPKPERKAYPPPMEFAALLKLAEKKQYEPVVIESKPKVDDERPMTKRQKREWEYLQEKQRREQQEKTNKKPSVTNMPSKPSKVQLNKIPKKPVDSNLNSTQNKNSVRDIGSIPKKIIDNKSNDKCDTGKAQGITKNDVLEKRKKIDAEKKRLEEMLRAVNEEERKLEQTESKQARPEPSNAAAVKSEVVDKQVWSKNNKPRSLPSENLKPPSILSSNKSKESSSADVKLVKSKQIAKKPVMFDKKRESICTLWSALDLIHYKISTNSKRSKLKKNIANIF